MRDSRGSTALLPLPDGYSKICTHCNARHGAKIFGPRVLDFELCVLCATKDADFFKRRKERAFGGTGARGDPDRRY